MEDYKPAQLSKTWETDYKVMCVVDSELRKLCYEAEIPEYKTFLEKRRIELLSFLSKFEENAETVNFRLAFLIKVPDVPSEPLVERIIDSIIKEKIDSKLEEEISNCDPKEIEEIVQMSDRRFTISWLLGDFDKNTMALHSDPNYQISSRMVKRLFPK